MCICSLHSWWPLSEQTMTVSWLKCQQTSSFSPGQHSAHPNTQSIPAFPSLCSSVYRNGLPWPFYSWPWGGCQHMCFSSWRRTWPQSSRSGGFRSSLPRFLFIGLHLGSSFLLGEPWFPNAMKLPPPALISPWNCFICDSLFFSMSMCSPVFRLLRAESAHI